MGFGGVLAVWVWCGWVVWLRCLLFGLVGGCYSSLITFGFVVCCVACGLYGGLLLFTCLGCVVGCC